MPPSRTPRRASWRNCASSAGACQSSGPPPAQTKRVWRSGAGSAAQGTGSPFEALTGAPSAENAPTR
jgi:hypothetical protein